MDVVSEVRGNERTALTDDVLAPSAEAPQQSERAVSRAAEPIAQARDVAQPPVEAPVAAAPAPNVPSRAPTAVQAVPRFELPLNELAQLADGAGLHWVHSDADKVTAVQQAIAAEPKPMHVPRERKAAALSDEGPLVLVETRKDLSELVLPFERQTLQGQHPPQ